MSDALALSVQIRKRNAEIEWLKGKIALLMCIGCTVQLIAEAKAELLYTKRFVAPASVAEIVIGEDLIPYSEVTASARGYMSSIPWFCTSVVGNSVFGTAINAVRPSTGLKMLLY